MRGDGVQEVLTHQLFIDVFVASSEVRGTGSDGLALIQYHATMAGSAEFANMI